MEKFSKMKPEKEITDKSDVLYTDDHIEIIKYEDWSIIKDKDIVVCIIYLIETNQFILRHEYVPTFEYKDGQQMHLTVVGGGIEKGESPEKALIREIEEEAGIVISPDYKIEMMKPLFVSKGCTSKFYPALIVLTENQYQEVIAQGDGSKIEKMSRSIKLDTKFVNKVNCSDLITDYLLIKLKEYINIT